MRITKLLYYLLILSILYSCSPTILEVPKKEPARLGYVTSVHQDLINLPKANEKIVVAVYKFRDQTGQYKTSSTGVSWSTAVTQGATSMLLKALEDSKWFTVIEREGLSNLLNERRIIRSSRENYAATEGQKLPPMPPLLYAGIILEGGIISYETNTVTGGMGAKYFGIGGSTQYRKDEVSIYLRAVSTQTGRVLKTVYTTKSILSMAVDVGVYRYVRFKRLLEVETGFSVNEPPQMCVLEAIEKAVFSMIVEGVLSDLWSLEKPQDVRSPLVTRYLKERDKTEGNFNYKVSPNMAPRDLGFGLNIGGEKYVGDYSNIKYEPSLEGFIRFNFSPKFAFLLSGQIGRISNNNHFKTNIGAVELKGVWMLLPNKRFSPFLVLGGGFLDYSPRTPDDIKIVVDRSKDEINENFVASIIYGGGIEYFINERWSLQSTTDFRYTFSDQLDGKINGTRNDGFWGSRMGITYYFGQ